MCLNKRGAALFQVLIVSAILAGIATMVLRSSLSRTVTARQTRHTVSSQLIIESCMAEVNGLWASKTSEQYIEDLAECRFYLDSGNPVRSYTCSNASVGRNAASAQEYSVTAEIASGAAGCEITYRITNGTDI